MPPEKRSVSHQGRGTTATSKRSIQFHAPGAVPMPAVDDPEMASSSATVAASGNGQAHTSSVRPSPSRK